MCSCQKSESIVINSSESSGTTVATTITQNVINTSSETETFNTKGYYSNKESQYDIDLTVLSSTMVYAQVYDMVYNGEKYLGMSVKAKGPFAYCQNENGEEFFAVIISDATACCAQGLEFVLDGDYKYPDDYPELGTEITITGVFNYYEENGNKFCQLLNATYETN